MPHFDAKAINDPSWAMRREAIAKKHQKDIYAHVRNKTTDMASGSMSNDKSVYLDQDRFTAEKQKLFRKIPLLAGLTGDIPMPGDKMLFDEVDLPILVLRGRDGKVRAFLNICKHRAAKLVETCDSHTRMTCRFHGWTYDLQGKLIGLPGSEGFKDINRDDLGLIELPATEWAGMIFVVPDPDGKEIDLPSFIGDFAPELEQLGLACARPVKRTRIDVATNWKYALDTYGEGYHFATLHPSTIHPMTVNNVMLYDRFGPHHRCVFPDANASAEANLPEEKWSKPSYSGIHLLFPNSVLNITPLPDGSYYYALQRMFPGKTAGEAFTIISSYRVGGDDDAPDDVWIEYHDFIAHVVETEDYSVSAAGWKNLLHAPKGFRVHYGANELALQYLHKQIAKAIHMPLP